MKQVFIEWNQKKYQADLTRPLDISIPLASGSGNPNAFGIPAPSFEPLRDGSFIGSVAQGGSVNCENLFINAHGNGTHTECVGHISRERITINQTLTQFFFVAKLVSVTPEGNTVTQRSMQAHLQDLPEALIIRTLPNQADKRTRMYSGNDPGYLEVSLCEALAGLNIKHLLIDLPSVDPERDEGKLSAHHAFWKYPQAPRMDATITEMIFAADTIPDGLYLLNIQIASLESDASPSKPVLYALTHAIQ
jgi:arylformamidase